MYRNKEVERCLVEFHKILPLHFRQFPFDTIAAILTLSDCRIYSYQEFAKYCRVSVKKLIRLFGSKDGCTHKVGDGFIIMFNDCWSISRKRKMFTLAHELGHILLAHLTILEKYKISPTDRINKYFENEADYFAISLLAPAPILNRVKPKSIWAVQKGFGLSREDAEMAFDNYVYYDKYHNIEWHNEMLRLFGLERSPLDIALHTHTDFGCEAATEIWR